MRVYAILLLFFLLLGGSAFLVRVWIAPDLAPVADSDLPNWKFQLAFILQSIQNIGLGGAVLSVVAAFLRLVRGVPE